MKVSDTYHRQVFWLANRPPSRLPGNSSGALALCPRLQRRYRRGFAPRFPLMPFRAPANSTYCVVFFLCHNLLAPVNQNQDAHRLEYGFGGPGLIISGLLSGICLRFLGMESWLASIGPLCRATGRIFSAKRSGAYRLMPVFPALTERVAGTVALFAT